MIRLKARFATRPYIIKQIEGKLVNFGSEGSFKRTVGETLGEDGVEQLVPAASQAEFKVLHETTKMCEEYNPKAEASLKKEIAAKEN